VKTFYLVRNLKLELYTSFLFRA